MPSPSINDALSVLPAKINLSRVAFTSLLPDPWPQSDVRKPPPAGGADPSNVTVSRPLRARKGRRGGFSSCRRSGVVKHGFASRLDLDLHPAGFFYKE